jgi:Fur family ferric uptake transcriptional regulator
MEPIQRLEEHLAKHSKKMTNQRRVILEVFESMDGHASLEEVLINVQQKMTGVGMATIYRTMKLFTDAGIAHERRFDDGLTRYEMHHEGEHHDHLICIKCNRIIEFEDEIIEARQETVAAKYGIKILSHKLELYGTCVDADSCEYFQNRQSVG